MLKNIMLVCALLLSSCILAGLLIVPKQAEDCSNHYRVALLANGNTVVQTLTGGQWEDYGDLDALDLEPMEQQLKFVHDHSCENTRVVRVIKAP